MFVVWSLSCCIVDFSVGQCRSGSAILQHLAEHDETTAPCRKHEHDRNGYYKAGQTEQEQISSKENKTDGKQGNKERTTNVTPYVAAAVGINPPQYAYHQS